MSYEDKVKLLASHYLDAWVHHEKHGESLEDYTRVVHPPRVAFMEAVEEMQREIDRLVALNSEPRAGYYEMDDVDRELVSLIRSDAALDDDEAQDALRLLLKIIDEGYAA